MAGYDFWWGLLVNPIPTERKTIFVSACENAKLFAGTPEVTPPYSALQVEDTSDHRWFPFLQEMYVRKSSKDRRAVDG